MDDELPFTVELWADDKRKVERLLARICNVMIGHVCFAAAVEEYPGKRILLRQKARVLRET